MIINGNSLNIPLADRSVHCVVTSPPYFQMRDYGTAKWEGGDPDCDHVANPNATKKYGNPDMNRKSGSRENTIVAGYYSDICPKCGAKRIDNQLGLEGSPQAYIDNMVQVFREVRRVLRDDGVVWVNMGDAYNAKPAGKLSRKYVVDQTVGDGAFRRKALNHKSGNLDSRDPKSLSVEDLQQFGIKEKDLMGIPWMLAFALRADGWYLRSDVIWFKTNPVPESVRDRPTKSHEYVFMLTKSNRYFFDMESVRVKYTQPINRWGGEKIVPNGFSPRDVEIGTQLYRDRNMRPNEDGRHMRSVWYAEEEEYRQFLEWKQRMVDFCDVWTIPSRASGYKHYAQFPLELVTPCVMASTSEKGVCAYCGQPVERKIERGTSTADVGGEDNGDILFRNDGQKYSGRMCETEIKTVGWEAMCSCYDGTTVPAIVFDPFLGSGTTMLEAERLGRRGVGIELSMDYIRDITMHKTWKQPSSDWSEARPKQVAGEFSDLPLFDEKDGNA